MADLKVVQINSALYNYVAERGGVLSIGVFIQMKG